jgi:hypothetical protein
MTPKRRFPQDLHSATSQKATLLPFGSTCTRHELIILCDCSETETEGNHQTSAGHPLISNCIDKRQLPSSGKQNGNRKQILKCN